jgi:methionine--tRNA ligase beta chain
MDQITIEDVLKLDLRVGLVKEAVKVDWSEKLLRLRVDFGELGEKTVFTGIYHWYKPEEFQDKKLIFVVNVTPKKVGDEFSEAMILAAEDKETDTLSVIMPDADIALGARVY